MCLAFEQLLSDNGRQRDHKQTEGKKTTNENVCSVKYNGSLYIYTVNTRVLYTTILHFCKHVVLLGQPRQSKRVRIATLVHMQLQKQ